jgi:hypothetical protein
MNDDRVVEEPNASQTATGALGRPGGEPSENGRGRARWWSNPQVLIAGVALLVSAASVVVAGSALWVAVEAGRADRYHKRISVRPHIEMSFWQNSEAAGWSYQNSGLGPAVIKSFRVLVDEKPRRDWKDMLRGLGIGVGRYNYINFFPGNIVPAGPPATIFKFEGQDSQSFLPKLHRIEFELCYCSLYNECWMTWTQKRQVVDKCEREDERPFGVIGDPAGVIRME